MRPPPGPPRASAGAGAGGRALGCGLRASGGLGGGCGLPGSGAGGSVAGGLVARSAAARHGSGRGGSTGADAGATAAGAAGPAPERPRGWTGGPAHGACGRRGRCRGRPERGSRPGRRSGRRAHCRRDVEAPLEPVEARHDAVGGVVGAGQQHPGAEQLEQQAGRGGAAHLGQAGGDEVGGATQLDGAEAGRLGDQPLAWSCGTSIRPVDRGVGDGGDDHQVAQPAQQVLGEAARVLPGLDHLVDDAEHRGAVGGGEGVDDLVEQGVGGEAEQRGWPARG